METERPKYFLEFPDCRMHFQMGDGRSLALDPIETMRQIHEIAKATKGQEGFGYVDLFADWVAKKTSVRLTPAEADWLMDKVQAEYFEQKKLRQPWLTLSTSTG